MQVSETEIVEYYDGTCFNGRWILPSGDRVCPYWQDHRSIAGVDGIENLRDALEQGMVSIHHSGGDVNLRYAGWRPGNDQIDVLRPILERASDVYVEQLVDGEMTSHSAPADMPVQMLVLKILDPVAYRCEVAYDEDGYL